MSDRRLQRGRGLNPLYIVCFVGLRGELQCSEWRPFAVVPVNGLVVHRPCSAGFCLTLYLITPTQPIDSSDVMLDAVDCAITCRVYTALSIWMYAVPGQVIEGWWVLHAMSS